MDIARVRKLINYIRTFHKDEFAKTLKIVEGEMLKCKLCGMTEKMRTYGNILLNTLVEGRKIVIDEKRAWLVNFTIAGEA